MGSGAQTTLTGRVVFPTIRTMFAQGQLPGSLGQKLQESNLTMLFKSGLVLP